MAAVTHLYAVLLIKELIVSLQIKRTIQYGAIGKPATLVYWCE